MATHYKPNATPTIILLVIKSQMMGTWFKHVPTRPIMTEIKMSCLLPFCMNFPAEAEPIDMPMNTLAPTMLPQNDWSSSVFHPY